jgi:hypothetical protein
MVEHTYLFLDVDGVLNHLVWDRRMWHHFGRTLREPYEKIDPECMSRLNRICRWTNCYVVISSSWRVGRTVEEFAALFRELGFTGEIVGMTSGGYDRNRGKQILGWLHEVNEDDALYVVLEDEPSDMEDITQHVIHINNRVGLTDNDARVAIERLGGPNKAVVAKGERDCGVVLWSVGGQIRSEIDEFSSLAEDLKLEDCPPGISVWEGTFHVVPSSLGESYPDTEPRGEFRCPDDEEWDAIRMGVNPWEPLRYRATKDITLKGVPGVLRQGAILEDVGPGFLVLNPTCWEDRQMGTAPFIPIEALGYQDVLEVFLADVKHRDPRRLLVTKTIHLGGEWGRLKPGAVVELIAKGKLWGKAFVRNLDKWDVEHPERKGPIPWVFDGEYDDHVTDYKGGEPGLV